MGVIEQYASVRAELDKVCRACGCDPRQVTLVAVSKTVGLAEVAQAIEAGCVDFGENRPDQLVEKHAAFPQARWHFIGNLQSRRIGDIVGRAHLMHSVFKADHLPKIEAAAAAVGIVQDILLEVNSGEEAKGGVAPSDAAAFIEKASGLSHVRICGLMTMAPQGDPQRARACFAELRTLRDKLEASGVAAAGQLAHLSMGMSEDWQVAVWEGATIIRVGRAVFSSDFV